MERIALGTLEHITVEFAGHCRIVGVVKDTILIFFRRNDMYFEEENQLGDFFCRIFTLEKFAQKRQVAENRNFFLFQSGTAGVKTAHHDNLFIIEPQVTFDTADGDDRHGVGGTAHGDLFIFGDA